MTAKWKKIEPPISPWVGPWRLHDGGWRRLWKLDNADGPIDTSLLHGDFRLEITHELRNGVNDLVGTRGIAYGPRIK